MGGLAVLRYPGPPFAAPGEIVDITELTGQSAGIAPTGDFLLEDVLQGEWQVDIYYLEFGAPGTLVGARYMHSELVTVEGQDVIPLVLQVR